MKFAKTTLGVAVGLVACLAVATAAYALTTFDPVTGIGFVGKGDLQTPWGWSDQKLQAEAANVTFSYEEVDEIDYSVVCEFDTGPAAHLVHHVVTHNGNVDASVSYDPKSKSRTNPLGKVNGFILYGIDPDSTVVTDDGDVPAVGDTCLGDPVNGVVTSVTVVDSTSSATLYASDAIAGTGPTGIWIDGVSVHP
jgi:hypothetical protein